MRSLGQHNIISLTHQPKKKIITKGQKYKPNTQIIEKIAPVFYIDK